MNNNFWTQWDTGKRKRRLKVKLSALCFRTFFQDGKRRYKYGESILQFWESSFRPLWGYGPNFVAWILMTFGLKVDSSNVVVNVDCPHNKSNEMLPKTRGHVSVILSFCSGVFRAFGKFRDTWLWFTKLGTEKNKK